MPDRAPSDEWLPPRAPGASPIAAAPPPAARDPARRAWRVAAAPLLLLNTLALLVAFGMPTEDGLPERPGFLIPWYLLPVVGTVAAGTALFGAPRRPAARLLAAMAACAGWVAVLFVW